MQIFNIYWKNYKIGLLIFRNNKYLFMYNKEELKSAKNEGFDKLIGFPDINKIYLSSKLFPIFASRIKSLERLKNDNIIYNNDLNKLTINSGMLITDNIKITCEDINEKHL